jgi:hypothetical protein
MNHGSYNLREIGCTNRSYFISKSVLDRPFCFGGESLEQIAFDAYLYAYPLVLMDVTMRQMTNVPYTNNKLGRAPRARQPISSSCQRCRRADLQRLSRLHALKPGAGRYGAQPPVAGVPARLRPSSPHHRASPVHRVPGSLCPRVLRHRVRRREQGRLRNAF